ncbi:DUF3105 domain-containing protein [Nocardioides sp. TF02-7]|uniref:DUF3105 domain-containing protein n=1 Tax=Nocardioides sp. TF02-7 TaxID=2917724 RepID=UPI001F0604F7|nr:DUF3105 domain-containing protein [Nocardioides sp. TF02-7]UMG92248.1 DUF3105 domain-containing protein [Nocardioides sp. TF02-7]
MAALALLVLGPATLSGCGSSADDQAPDPVDESAAGAGVEGIVEYDDLTRNHVEGTVDYPQNPPVGGDHAPVWMNCGAYAEPITPEMAVHSLEHGAVWIAYDPSLETEQVELLSAAADSNGYVLVSPVAEMDSPVVATAWGVQLPLDTADDERLNQFITSYAQGPQTPEPGAPCTGGMGG